MKQADLFVKTLRDSPKDEKSLNAELLLRAGFIDKLASGVYTYLPLGLRVIKKIKSIIREEMNALGSQEILMPALTPKENWEKTGRFDVAESYKIKDEDLVLGWTHEEIITPLMIKHILSYKDLPCSVYQIQNKFRNEPRAKSGLLRGKEFIMKDMYSFHRTAEDLNDYYEKAKQAYFKIFERCGLKEVYLTIASGGEFTKEYSHEFQAVAQAGEDNIYICNNCGLGINKEVKNEECQNCGKTSFIQKKSIEVGNIFKLYDRYSLPIGLKDEKGNPVLMGCYGIGISRLMGTIAESSNDNHGIIWPKNIAPFQIHLLEISGNDESIKAKAEEIYAILQNKNFEVLYDNRDEKTAGEKLNDSDLLGIPIRLVISKKTLAEKSVELKKRESSESYLIKLTDLIKYVEQFFE